LCFLLSASAWWWLWTTFPRFSAFRTKHPPQGVHHKPSEYNSPPGPPSGWSGGTLDIPWTCPIPIEPPQTPVFDQPSLSKSLFSGISAAERFRSGADRRQGSAPPPRLPGSSGCGSVRGTPICPAPRDLEQQPVGTQLRPRLKPLRLELVSPTGQRGRCPFCCRPARRGPLFASLAAFCSELIAPLQFPTPTRQKNGPAQVALVSA
jgi:hypothetical protein